MEDLLHINFRPPSTPERDREQENAQHCQQLQMTPPSICHERAAAASALHQQNPPPPSPQPFPASSSHLPAQNDPFALPHVTPPLLGAYMHINPLIQV